MTVGFDRREGTVVRVVEIFYFATCPGWIATRDALAALVREHGLVDVDVRHIAVEDDAAAQRLRFLGSPSVRVDGVDIEPPPASEGASVPLSVRYALRCRVYPHEGKLVGTPPRALLAAALGIIDAPRAEPHASVRLHTPASRTR